MESSDFGGHGSTLEWVSKNRKIVLVFRENVQKLNENSISLRRIPWTVRTSKCLPTSRGLLEERNPSLIASGNSKQCAKKIL